MRVPPPQEQALDLIYEAALDPSLWVDVINRVTTLVNGEHAVLTRLNIEDGLGSAMVGGDPAVLDSYFGHFYRINPIQLVDDASRYVSGWTPKVMLDEDCVSRESLVGTEYYNDFLRPLGAEWSLIIRLGLSELDVTAISIGRHQARGRFEPTDITAASRLQPHLIRANVLRERFASLQGVNTGLAAALDRAASAMFLLRGDAHILHANAPGERLLSQGDVLCAAQGRLSAAAPDAAQALAAAIASAVSPDWEQRSAVALRLRIPGQSYPLVFTASPVRLEHVSAAGHGRAVLVQVQEPDAGATSGEAQLVARFSLTKAEARLASALHQGLSLKAAAELHGVSSNTARNQLASIFTKTGTHRQLDLVRLMGAGGVAVGSPPQ